MGFGLFGSIEWLIFHLANTTRPERDKDRDRERDGERRSV